MRRVLRLIWLLALVSCVTPDKPAPAQKPHVPEDANDAATLRIGPCFGECPAYELTVGRDGRATFDGTDKSCLIGKFAAVPPPALVQALFELIAKTDLSAPRKKTREATMGLPDASPRDLEVRSPARIVKVRIARGGKAPAHLAPIEAAFHKLKDASEWRQVDAPATPKTCPAHAR